MTTQLEAKFERLLRWYPRAWREENGEFLLAVLVEDARERGKTKPSPADAWSICAHGLAARSTPNATLGAAAAALAISLIPAISLFVGFTIEPAWLRWLLASLHGFAGPLLLFVTVLMYARRHGGVVSAPAAVTALGFWALHSAFAACARLSWSIGWDEANRSSLTENHATWFGDSTLLWLGLAAATGILALSILFRWQLGWRRSRVEAWAGAAAISAACLVGLFVTTVMPITPLAAGVMLVLCALELGRESGALQTSPSTNNIRPYANEPTSQPQDGRRIVQTRSLTPQGRTRLVTLLVLAALTAVAGAFCAALALAGSAWSPAFRDSTHSMNRGLAFGCLTLIPLVCTGAWMLARRFGARWLAGGAFLVAALLLESASQWLGAGHPMQQLLWLLAALCVGAALTVPLAWMLSATKLVSVVVAVGGTLFLSLTVGLAIPGLPFVAPVVCVAIACWAAVRLAVDARRTRALSRGNAGPPHSGFRVTQPEA